MKVENEKFISCYVCGENIGNESKAQLLNNKFYCHKHIRANKTELTAEEYNNLPEEDKQLFAEMWQFNRGGEWHDINKEIFAKWDDFANFYRTTHQIYRLKPVEAPVKETIEEAAIRIIRKNHGEPFHSEIERFKLGANWQKDQDKANLKQQVIEILEAEKVKVEDFTDFNSEAYNETVDMFISKIKQIEV